MQISEGVSLDYQNNKLKAKGPKGEVSRDFPHTTQLKINGNDFTVSAPNKALENTAYAHIKNMMVGVKDGFKTKMKMIFAHFPMTVEIKGKDMFIKNFLGEKQPRKAVIVGDVKIEVKGQEVFVSGSNIEFVGQTVANIRTATKIRFKDGRVFQDGIYPIE